MDWTRPHLRALYEVEGSAGEYRIQSRYWAGMGILKCCVYHTARYM